MASRRVSISALLCQEDPPVTSPTRPEGWSPPKVPTSSPDSLDPARQRPTRYHHDPYREAVPSHPHQSAPPRRTPSPDFSHPPLYAWPPPRRAYNPPQVPDMFTSLQYDPEPSSSSPLRTSQQSQLPYMPSSPPRPSYSQSPFPTTRLPSDSPASTISLTRPPSIHSPSSPLLYTQRSALSPGGYYHSPPFSTASHHDPSFQTSASPNLRHPRNSHTEPVASSSMHHSSLSRISTTSSSSFPQALLNPVSPQQSPLGGLEALVQAATVERDRLEARASLDRKVDPSRSAVQRSPELLFRSSLEGPRIHLQAPAPRTPVTSPLMPGPLLRDSYSESSLRMGARPDVQTSKRRRQSDSLSGSERSWDSPLPLDSSSQFSGLMGPGMKPRRLSSEIRTEVRPTLPLPSRDMEEAAAAGSRMSPPRDHATRRSYAAEEPKTFQTHVPDYRETVPSAIIAPDVSRYVFATEDPRPSVHQEPRSNVDSHPPPRKILRSDLIGKQGTPSPPPPPRPLSAPLEPPAPPAPTPPEQIQLCDQDEECSPQRHSPPHNDIPTPAATAPQRFAEIESAASSEKTMDLTIRRVSAIQEPSTALADSFPPDNLTTTAQRSPVIPASPLSSNVYDDSFGPAEPAKSPSPPLPSPEARCTDIALEAPDIESCLATPRLSSPAPEDILNQPTPEPETGSPPTTASPSPRPSSPDASSFKDGTSVHHPVAVQITAASETGTVIPLPEVKDSVKAEVSPASPEELETMTSPAVATPAPAVEVVSLPVLDISPGTGHAPTAMDIDIRSEAALELADIAESKPSVDDQRHADMDVDEELLNLIGDTPSRSSHTSFKKQESPPTEDKYLSSHLPVKPEDAPGILISSPPSPAATAFPTPQEGVSMFSPDTALSARDSKTSTVKLDERSVPKKKAKQHAQAKGRVKPSGSTKTKLKVPSDGASAASLKSKKSLTVTKKSAIAARSRSTSVMPASTTPVPGSENRVPGEAEPDDDEDGMEDKLYCICNTKYDDERVMIACDRCDEWYHTSCVDMPDLEVDLVDQFICPLCVEKNPQLHLRTTWKRRCLNGLKQRDPNSPDACHKPARGAFSKYCSDECGVQYMHMRISLWIESGGDCGRLWETVKNAERREGVVVSARVVEEQSRSPITTEGQAVLAIVPPKISKAERELARLRARLETLVRKREELKAEMDVVVWREKVTELAIQHADTIEQCGWDQRLCFGDEEVAEFGTSVLESYEEGHPQTDVDGAQEEAEWWCTGKKKCDRHSGWQKLRMADVEFDKETKDQALQKLTKLEREIRKRVEDILDPQAHLDKAKMLEPSSPRVPVLSRPTVNGQPKHRPNGDQHKKGKKRKE